MSRDISFVSWLHSTYINENLTNYIIIQSKNNSKIIRFEMCNYIHFLRLKNLSKGIIFINYFLLYIYIRQLQLYNLRNWYLMGLSSVRYTFPLPPKILHTIICEVCVENTSIISIRVEVWELFIRQIYLYFIAM